MARSSNLDRFQGCILGAAIGDALGAPYEHMHSSSAVVIKPDGYDQGVYNTAPGAPTDDSTLTRFHANAWVAAGHNTDARHRVYVEQLIDWYNSNPKDMGHQTRAAIATHIINQDARAEGRSEFLPVKDTGSCGNGSLMAVAPAGLMARNLAEAGGLGHEFSVNTHPNELCRYVCGVFASAIFVASRTDEDNYMPMIGVPTHLSIDGRAQGYVAITGGLAFKALNLAVDLEAADKKFGATLDYGFEALKWIIGLGGDTDTNASVAGALIGAYYGMTAWQEPGWLLETLEGTDDWLKLAEDLYNCANLGV